MVALQEWVHHLNQCQQQGVMSFIENKFIIRGLELNEKFANWKNFFSRLGTDIFLCYRENIILKTLNAKNTRPYIKNRKVGHKNMTDEVRDGGMNLLGKVDAWDNLIRIKSESVAQELMGMILKEFCDNDLTSSGGLCVEKSLPLK